jgi:hypothetical protein
MIVRIVQHSKNPRKSDRHDRFLLVIFSFCVLAMTVQAQRTGQESFRGVVVDENHELIAGALITLTGETNHSTQSDADGKFGFNPTPG